MSADLLVRLSRRVVGQTGPAVMLSEEDKMRIAAALEFLADWERGGFSLGLPPVGHCQ
jgi:hypothetical protein